MADGCHGHARQLHGYLQAVSALKDDGSLFLCAYLGAVAPQASFDAVCRALGLAPDGLHLAPMASVACSGIACTPRQWLLERMRPQNAADRQPLDGRLYDGFVCELEELLGAEAHWYQLVSSVQRSLAPQLGAIWSVFVFGTGAHAYVMHCSWDS